MLTQKQQKLVSIIEHRLRYGMPTVQRDLAEALGVRRDSLNKLLSRTRRSLECEGASLPMPPRSGSHAATPTSLAHGD